MANNNSNTANKLYSSDEEDNYDDYDQHLGKCKQFISNPSVMKMNGNKGEKTELMQEQIKAKQLKIQLHRKAKEEERERFREKAKENEKIKRPTTVHNKQTTYSNKNDVVDDWEDLM